MEKKIKIIYIIGTGRNGSTLIDVVLGNSKKIQSTGELFNAIGAWRINKVCSCNKTVDDCPFWSKVKQLFIKTSKDLELSDISAMQKYFERKMLSPFNILVHKLLHSKKFKQYKKSLKEFYTAIAIVSEKPVLVDSSKNPFRGYSLLNVFKDDVYFIHLIRDGRGQMWSWIKSGVMPPFNIPIRKNEDGKEAVGQHFWWVPILYAFSWVLYNLISFLIVWKAGRKQSVRIQYEDFIRNPSYHLKRISELINEDLGDLEELFVRKEPFRIDHLIAGNRLRMLKKITVRLPDEVWKTKLSAKYKKIFWLVAGWLARLYGYRFDN
jgi:hypothetical protein